MFSDESALMILNKRTVNPSEYEGYKIKDYIKFKNLPNPSNYGPNKEDSLPGKFKQDFKDCVNKYLPEGSKRFDYPGPRDGQEAESDWFYYGIQRYLNPYNKITYHYIGFFVDQYFQQNVSEEEEEEYQQLFINAFAEIIPFWEGVHFIGKR